MRRRCLAPNTKGVRVALLTENYPLADYVTVLRNPASSCFLVEPKNQLPSVVVAYVLSRVAPHNTFGVRVALPTNTHKRLTGHILSIGVLPSHRRLASQLIYYVEQDLQTRYAQLHSLMLNVRKSNKPHHSMLQQIGGCTTEKDQTLLWCAQQDWC